MVVAYWTIWIWMMKKFGKENIIMLLRLSEKQPQQFCFIEDKNGSIHKQVGKQRT